MTDPRRGGDAAKSSTGSEISFLSRLPPPRFDIAVAVAVFGTSIVNVATQDGAGTSQIPIAGFLMLAAGSVAVLWRRRHPLAVLGASLAMSLAWTVLGYPGNPVFHILVSLYAVGRYAPNRRTGVVALAAAFVVVVVGQVVDGDQASDVVTGLVLTALAWYVGRLVRVRAAAATERAEHREWKRATEAQRVIDDARAAIARELHDVVAHNVSVMTVQASVARLVVAEDPEKAQEAIGAVEQAGRRALDELRQLLGVLRPETASDELVPQPALNQVQQLVDQLKQTGLDISLSADVASKLPVRADLFAYRIVQEALTNVLKHGGVEASAHVRVEEADGHVDIEVTDTGKGTTTMPGAGQGIVGMRERALLLGGSFEAGPRPEGGFRVFARLPTGEQ